MYMADRRLLQVSRMLGAFSQPLHREFSDVVHSMRSPSANVKYYADWSNWGWLRTLVKTIVLLRDGPVFQHIGFSTDFSSQTMQRMLMQDEAVAKEDWLAERLALFLSHLLRARASGMSWHSMHYPGILVGLCNEDPSVRQRALSRFKLHYESWQACGAQPYAKARSLHNSSALNTPAMKVAVHLAKQGPGGFGATAELLSFGEACCGWGHSKTCEGAFQHLRDHETRGASSRIMTNFNSWSVPVHHHLLADYGICEIKPDLTKLVPANACDISLFKAVSRRPEHESLDLDRILGKQKWLTWDSVSRAGQYAELALITCMSMDRGGWSTSLGWRGCCRSSRWSSIARMARSRSGSCGCRIAPPWCGRCCRMATPGMRSSPCLRRPSSGG